MKVGRHAHWGRGRLVSLCAFGNHRWLLAELHGTVQWELQQGEQAAKSSNVPSFLYPYLTWMKTNLIVFSVFQARKYTRTESSFCIRMARSHH